MSDRVAALAGPKGYRLGLEPVGAKVEQSANSTSRLLRERARRRVAGGVCRPAVVLLGGVFGCYFCSAPASTGRSMPVT